MGRMRSIPLHKVNLNIKKLIAQSREKTYSLPHGKEPPVNHYPFYPARRRESLDGIWDFKFLDSAPAFDELSFGDVNVECDDSMAVPGAFDAGPAYAGKRGVGVYRRTVHTGGAAAKLRLNIGGLGLRARIFWDGVEIAATRLAYSPLAADIDAGDAETHELVIATDNRFEKNNRTLLQPNYDFYCYGGIYRHTELEWLPRAFIERAYVKTLDLDKGEVSVRLILGGTAATAKRCTVAFDANAPFEVALKPKGGVAEFTATVPDAQRWSPAHPHLHTVRIGIGEDVIVERFGLRTVRTEKGRILLNGQAVKLRGFCRHEAHPQFGPAIPDALQVEDMQFLKDMNCNFVRCVHYPQNQLFLDLCDQNGILVWVESLGWGDTAERLADPVFGDLQERQTRQMIRDACNHPAVIIWAFLNEGESHRPESKALYARLIGAVREEDPTRLVTYASNREDKDLSYGLIDIISMNIYPVWMFMGWEETRPLGEIGRMIDRLAAFCNRDDLKDKPFILSEIGTCGLHGWRDRLKSGWSEEYQADYFSEAIRRVFANERMSGLSLWQMYDTRTFPNGEVRSKARAYNNAGALDEYRRPKLAYDAVKEIFGTLAKGT